jgi:hypothetical protein
MDRALLEEKLKQAERLVSTAEQKVVRQRGFVDSLNPKTLAARHARELLARFEEALAAEEDARNRLLQEFRSSGSPGEPRHPLLESTRVTDASYALRPGLEGRHPMLTESEGSVRRERK